MPDPSTMTFADLLRHYRRTAGLTQEALAERAGLSVHGIQKLERGVTHPYRDTAKRLAAALELRPEDECHLLEVVQPVRRQGSVRSEPNRQNLPLALSSFIGRDQAVATVRARLQAGRLLTLAGVGGCGKTRLALEVAWSVVDRYSDGVWLVELAPLTDGNLVAQRIGSVLGVRETAGTSITLQLVEALAGRRLLLIVDNCEHLLESCALVLDTLLRHCPGVQVLATSREPISIEGEIVWRVPSLAVPDLDTPASLVDLAQNPSVQLFVDRAVAVKPDFALTPQTAAAIALICQRLDGIPLALELAAARIEALAPEHLALRLDQRFRLLTGGSRAALPRQQTLEAALDWSYNLLSRPERLLFERLAVFADGWSLEAAEAVCSSHGVPRDEVFDLLARLVRKSLVIVTEDTDGATRYRLLETIHDYARDKLALNAEPAAAQTRERHAEYYTIWAERLNPTDGIWHLEAGTASVTLSQLEVEHDNLQAALAWRVEMARPAEGLRLMGAIRGWFPWRGAYSEASRWLETLLDLAERMPHATPVARWAMALGGAGTLALYRGDYGWAVHRLEQSVAACRDLADPAHLAFALSRLGLALWCSGDAEQASVVLEESISLSRTTGDWLTLAMSSRNLATIARSQGKLESACELLSASLAAAREHGWRTGYHVVRAISQLGRVAYLQGDVGKACALLREALWMIRDSGLRGPTLADSLDWLAAVETAQGDPLRAVGLFGAAEGQWRVSGAARHGPERAAYERDVARARAQVEEAAFAEAWAEGQAMNAEQAIAYVTLGPEVRAEHAALATCAPSGHEQSARER